MNNLFKNPKFITTHIIVLIIFCACLLMNGPMREGLPVGGDIMGRMAYVVENIFWWKVGWFMWMASALGLFLFSVFLADALKPSVFRNFAVGLVALGMAPDLIAEVVYAFILPMAYQSGAEESFLIFYEQLAVHLTGFLGNGLYCLGGLLLNTLLIKQRLVNQWIGYGGVVAWILGIGLSIAIAMGNMPAAEALTAASMVLSTLWMLIIAHTLFKSA